MAWVENIRRYLSSIRIVISFLFIAVFSFTEAAVVVKKSANYILVDVQPSELVEKGEEVCFEEHGKVFLSGKVVRAVGKKLAIRLKVGDADKVPLGKNFYMRSVNRSISAITAVLAQGKIESPLDERRYSLSLGSSMGLNYFFPVLQIEAHLEDGFTLGIMPLLFLQKGPSSSVTGYGAFTTLHYYFNQKPYEGWGIFGGPGAYSLSLLYDTEVEQAHLFAAMVQLEYRWLIADRWSIGANLGAQYVLATTTMMDVSFKGLLPLGSLYVSCGF